jgi:hypothetical protein
LEKGTRSLDDELINKFQHKKNDIFNIQYKTYRTFKIRPSGEYPTTSVRTPYQYIVVILYRLYGEQDDSKFTLSLMPLIHYYVDEGLSFNWDNILSTSIVDFITRTKDNDHGKFPRFHMFSYLLDIICINYQYPKMGSSWKPTDLSVHRYYKFLWEHKQRKKYHRICDHFISPLYELIFNTLALGMADKTLEIIWNIGDR